MVGNPLIIVAQDLSETFLNWAQPELSRTLPRLPIVLPNSPMAVQIRAIHAEKVLQTMIGIGFASLGACISQAVFGKSQQPIPT